MSSLQAFFFYRQKNLHKFNLWNLLNNLLIQIPFSSHHIHRFNFPTNLLNFKISYEQSIQISKDPEWIVSSSKISKPNFHPGIFYISVSMIRRGGSMVRWKWWSNPGGGGIPPGRMISTKPLSPILDPSWRQFIVLVVLANRLEMPRELSNNRPPRRRVRHETWSSWTRPTDYPPIAAYNL